MTERYPGGLIRKTPPTVTGPATSGVFAGEGGSASGVWTLADVLTYEKSDTWPKPVLPKSLYAWGANSSGQLGLGDTTNRSSPVQVGSLTDWVQMSSGPSHTACVTATGTLFTWGSNGSGQLGLNDVINRSSPVQVGALTNWAQVSAGASHTACVKADGTLWTWGLNNNSQLGLGNTINRSSPVQVGALTNWAQVSAGTNFTACVTTAGTLFTWGYGRFGQLGLNNLFSTRFNSPVQVGSLTNWAQVSAYRYNVACVKTDKTLWTWGRNIYGQLGGDTQFNYGRSSPVQVGSLTNWAQVSVGQYMAACVKTDGTLWTWGRNNDGELGRNNTINQSSPVQVGALTNWAQVSAGAGHAACVTTAGTLFTWGYNGAGQLGQNNVIRRSSPVQVGSLTNWAQVSSGNSQNLAILKG